MARLSHTTMFTGTPYVVAFLIGVVGLEANASGTGEFAFGEHLVEFHNRDVTLAGSLLIPKSDIPVPAVVFVHGAGEQTREPYREAGEHFARRGIAALIYDKRGVGQSSGVYESQAPYTNLVNDALAAIDLLKQRPEIAPVDIGIWGLSQGADIAAAAASRTDGIEFVMGVGASVADGSRFYYRANLFRKYGLSDDLLDMAEKAQLLQDTLPHNLQDGSLLSSFLPRSYPPPEKFVHPEWSRVHQPVLVMWGQLDQHQPVGESILGLKNSLARASNDRWTMIVCPRAKHSLGISETGAIQEEWRGYPPGALESMTDWAWCAIERPSEIDKMKLVGDAKVAGVLSTALRYEKLRWYGNGTVQAALWILFITRFLTNTIAGVRYGLTRLFHSERSTASQAPDKALSFRRALCALNLLILVGMGITMLLVLDQMHPSCPTVLRFLPLLGTVSTVATVALLIVHVRTLRDYGRSAARTIPFSLDTLGLVLFVPYMFYWNVVGLRL